MANIFSIFFIRTGRSLFRRPTSSRQASLSPLILSNFLDRHGSGSTLVVLRTMAMQRFWQNMNGLPLSALSVQLPSEFRYNVCCLAIARFAYEVAPRQR